MTASVGALAVPALELAVDGLPDAAQVLAARVASRFGTPDQCEVVIAGAIGWPAIPFGAALTLRVIGEDAALFTGEVTCVQMEFTPAGAVSARIRGYDVLHRLRKRQTLRVFEAVTVADVAEVLAGDLGLDVAVDGTGPRFARVVQHRQHDLDLLVEVAARAGLLIVLDGKTLRVVGLDGFGRPVQLHYGQSLYEATAEANVDRVARTVTAYGWHHQRAEGIEATANRPRTGPDVPLRVDPSQGYALSLVDQSAEDEDDLAGIAQSTLDASAARTVTLRGVAAGDARLRAGTRIRVTGLADEIDGGYVVCSAVHTVDANGYQTEFSTEPPPAPKHHLGASVTLGRVTAVDDPDGLGRVRVCLPALGDLDVGWLGVLCPGAGRGRGLVALPDVDDTVAVALPHAAPEQGVVLGALFGTIVPPDPGVSGSSVARWSLRTDDGQSIVVDDEAHSVRVEDKAGSFVELAPGTVRLHAEEDLVIEAPGGAITVRARSVDFEQAVV